MVAQDMALVPHAGGAPAIVRPLISAVEAAEAVEEYEALKRAILRKSDIHHEVDSKGRVREYAKKVYWRRVATFFGLSLYLVNEVRGFDEDGHLYYSVAYRAVAPNGRDMTADGYCSTGEKGKDWWSEHNIRATAHTRAKSRAISDMVGGGEVSAEEITGDEDDEGAETQRTPRRQITNGKAAPQRKIAAPAAPVTEDEMTAMTARFKAVGLARPQVEKFVRAQCGEDKGYNKALTRADWTKLDAALKTYEAKMARLTGASGTVADAAAAVVDAAPPAPAALDLTGEDEGTEDEQGA